MSGCFSSRHDQFTARRVACRYQPSAGGVVRLTNTTGYRGALTRSSAAQISQRCRKADAVLDERPQVGAAQSFNVLRVARSLSPLREGVMA